MSRLSAFATDRRGNVVLIFALAIFVLGMIVAAAVDLTRASSSKSHLQDATDASVLAAAKAYYFNASKPQAERLAAAQAAADAYMQSMVASRTAKSTLLNPTWKVEVSDKGVVTLTSKGASPAYLGAFFGIDKIDFTSVAVAQGGAPRLEIALVLDNTGSMGQNNKLGELKKAALGLVDSLEKGAAGSSIADPLKISLVPFSMTVRVDPSLYANADWIDSKGLASIHHEHFNGKSKTRFELLSQMGQKWAGCVERRPAKIGGAWVDYDITEAPPNAGAPDTLYVPYFAPDEPGAPGAIWLGSDRINNSYLDDGNSGSWSARQKNTAKYVSAPSGGGGPNQGCTLAPVARLTSETSGIKKTINDMVATGNTDIAFGLLWGWHTLSPNAPFKDARPYDEKNLSKIVILMSDGDNVNSVAQNPNLSTYSSLGYITTGRLGITGGSGGDRTVAMDARLAKLCENMKAQKIELYTMRVELAGSASTVLQNCASGPGHYFEVAKAADMNAAFQQIATSILELHLSK